MNHIAFIFLTLGLLLSVQAQDSCFARISISARQGASWTYASSSFQIYDISVVNAGTCPLTKITGLFSVGNGRITESWNYVSSSGLYSGFEAVLPAGATLNAGFVLANSTSPILTLTRFECSSHCGATAAPTTPSPSTVAPTTPSPSTVAPTTPSPSTVAPTTPSGPAVCNVSVSLIQDPTSWTDSQGRSNSLYRVVVTNFGTCPLSALTISLSYHPGSLTSSWNLDSSLGGWMVKGYGATLANGGAYSGAGFIVAGASSVVVNVYGSQCKCN